MRHIDLEQLILHYYDEPEIGPADRAAIEAHLAACSHCRAEREALAATLAAVSSVPVPERSATYGEEVWHRLQPRLKRSGPGLNPELASPADNRDSPRERRRERGPGWLGWFGWQRWALGGALAALLAAAFLAGRFWPRPEAPTRAAAPTSAQARDRVLLAAVADHMERSEILLMEIENAGGGGGQQIDISVQREQAQELAGGSRLYQQAAEQAGEAGLASLLDDLGRVLVTVGHSPSQVSPAELAELRARIEGPGLVFKLQVVNSGIEQRLKPESGKHGSGNVED
jgi:anti-sigma factor RsiW